MINDTVKFSKFIYFRVRPKRCPLHNKEARISVNGMNYRITNCCCPEFKSFLTSACEKYRIGILSGRYNFFPKKRLQPPRRKHQ